MSGGMTVQYRRDRAGRCEGGRAGYPGGGLTTICREGIGAR